MFLILDIKVVPNSGCFKIVQDKNGIIKCYVASAPQDGKANRELIKLWAEKLDISKNSIEIVSGLTSSRKKIKINTALTKPDLMKKLGFDLQESI